MIRTVAELLLAAAGAATVMAVVVLVSPVRTCPRCKGARVAPHWLTRATVRCARCNGAGRCCRRGAVTVHRLLWTIRGSNPPGKEK